MPPTNGPNTGFGDMATGCGPGQYIPDETDRDELNLIVRNGWYGHPNHKRGQTDTRQCAWRGTSVASTVDYTAPLMTLQSSTDGIIEFDSNHFDGQMRHNLIVSSKYEDGLFRIILSSDGRSVIINSIPAIPFDGDDTLAVTQAPNGNLIDARYETNECYVYRPYDPPTTSLKIYSVFPRRGGLAGGTTLSIYGANFNGTSILVYVGGSSCSNVAVTNSNTTIHCILPTSQTIGHKNVRVHVGNGKRATLNLAYQYITG
jgi:IPT/TIG domain